MSDAISIDAFVNSDDAIFHYTKLSVALENILYDGRFKLSSLSNTNDPWEYKIRLLSIFGSSVPLAELSLYRDAHKAVNRIILEESRVMCFCSNIPPTVILNIQEKLKDSAPSLVGCFKSRMWAQYGENHRGICLVFSKKEIENIFTGINGISFTKHMTYTARSMPLEGYTLNGDQLVKDGVEKYCYDHIKHHSDALFFTKNIDYRDEYEYRVVVIDPDGHYEYVDIGTAIRAIITGDRTPEVYHPIIQQLAEKYGIDYRHVRWEQGFPLLFKI